MVFSGSGDFSFRGVICETQSTKTMWLSESKETLHLISHCADTDFQPRTNKIYIFQIIHSMFHCDLRAEKSSWLKCIRTAPTFFRAAVMDMAAGRAGALAAGSGGEGLGCGRGPSEVDDEDAAATFSAAAMPTFIPRAASFHETQHQGSDYSDAPVRTSKGRKEEKESLHGPPKLSSPSPGPPSSSSPVVPSVRQRGRWLGPAFKRVRGGTGGFSKRIHAVSCNYSNISSQI